jgi:hypothetical protein
MGYVACLGEMTNACAALFAELGGNTLLEKRSRDSPFSTATRLRAGRPEVDCRKWQEISLFSVTRPALGFTQPPTQCVPGAVTLVVQRQGREANHSRPCSAESNTRT